MKKTILTLFVLMIAVLSFGQQTTDTTNSKINEYQPDWILVEKDGLLGFISYDGKEIVKTQYGKINRFGEYQADWALVEKDGYLGFINSEGKEIVKPKYDKIYPFGKYDEDWAMVEKDGFYGFISIEGKEIVKPIYESIIKEDKVEGIINGEKKEIKN
jgi:hypothetical protein